jgi:serine/threonine-protein kinase RsbW
MPETYAHKADARLTLTSRLADLALVRPWVDALAVEHALPQDTVFAIHLCLEEALSNIIRHGYGGEPNHAITIDFTSSGKSALTFIIEDSAPPFRPIEPAEAQQAPAPTSLDELIPGGQGIRLMRRFAGSLAWETLPHGNRLTIGFSIAPPKTQS